MGLSFSVRGLPPRELRLTQNERRYARIRGGLHEELENHESFGEMTSHTLRNRRVSQKRYEKNKNKRKSWLIFIFHRKRRILHFPTPLTLTALTAVCSEVSFSTKILVLCPRLDEAEEENRRGLRQAHDSRLWTDGKGVFRK